MKMLMVGDWHSATFEEPLSLAFERAGLEVLRFRWFHFFTEYAKKNSLANFASRFQNKYLFGFLLDSINKSLLKFIDQQKPNIIFIYRGTHVYAKTLKSIKYKYPTTYIICYNNDDPFSKSYPWWMWRHFIRSIQTADLMLAFRNSNIDSYYKKGAKKADLFRGYYNPSIHKKINFSNSCQGEYLCDVIFIGHFERDGRAEILDYLAGNNINLKIYGPTGAARKFGWDDAIKNSIHLKNQKVRYLLGQDYVNAINSAKIGLCFMSKLNNDTYTLRCFEIPACGTALFSEWSEDLESLFQNGVNAVLFKTKEELLHQVRYYLAHPEELALLAKRGHEHVFANGHDVFSRASWLVNKYSLLNSPGTINNEYASSN